MLPTIPHCNNQYMYTVWCVQYLGDGGDAIRRLFNDTESAAWVIMLNISDC